MGFWAGIASGIAGGGGGDGGSGGSDMVSNLLDRAESGGLVGKGLGYYLAKREAKKQQRRQDMMAAQARAGEAMDYRRGVQTNELDRNLSLLNDRNAADYLSSDLSMRTDADAANPAIRTQLEASQGYQPWMANDPFMGSVDFGRDYVDGRQEAAGAYADDSIARWEAAQQQLASEYDDTLGQIREDRDEITQGARDLFEQDTKDRIETEAESIVEAWIASRDKSENALPDFLRKNKDRSARHRAFAVLGFGMGDWMSATGSKLSEPDGKGDPDWNKGSLRERKERWIDALLAEHGSYTAAIENEPELRAALSADEYTSQPFAGWGK